MSTRCLNKTVIIGEAVVNKVLTEAIAGASGQYR